VHQEARARGGGRLRSKGHSVEPDPAYAEVFQSPLPAQGRRQADSDVEAVRTRRIKPARSRPTPGTGSRT
jgi:hypothetical protein